MPNLSDILLQLNGLELIPAVVESAPGPLLLQLPAGYLQFMAQYYGGCDFANNRYIDLWPVATITNLHPYFKWLPFGNQLIVIGSNGSGTLYGYNTECQQFFEVDEYFSEEDELLPCGTTFAALIHHLTTRAYD